MGFRTQKHISPKTSKKAQEAILAAVHRVVLEQTIIKNTYSPARLVTIGDYAFLGNSIDHLLPKLHVAKVEILQFAEVNVKELGYAIFYGGQVIKLGSVDFTKNLSKSGSLTKRLKGLAGISQSFQ